MEHEDINLTQNKPSDGWPYRINLGSQLPEFILSSYSCLLVYEIVTHKHAEYNSMHAEYSKL